MTQLLKISLRLFRLYYFESRLLFSNVAQMGRKITVTKLLCRSHFFAISRHVACKRCHKYLKVYHLETEMV